MYVQVPLPLLFRWMRSALPSKRTNVEHHVLAAGQITVSVFKQVQRRTLKKSGMK